MEKFPKFTNLWPRLLGIGVLALALLLFSTVAVANVTLAQDGGGTQEEEEAPTCPVEGGSLECDRQALIAFYNATDGDN